VRGQVEVRIANMLPLDGVEAYVGAHHLSRGSRRLIKMPDLPASVQWK